MLGQLQIFNADMKE